MSPDRTLVGRTAELASLARHASGVPGGCLAVIGEAGIGKSALVRAATVGLDLVLTGSSTAPPAPALRPLVEIAVEAMRRGADPMAPSLRVHRRATAALLPGILDPGAATLERDDAIHPVVLADALLRLLDTLPSAGRPTLLIEDLHWSDSDTLAVVEMLADRAPMRGGTLLLTLRPEGPAWPAVLRLAERRVAVLVELGPLAAAEVVELLALRLDTAPGEVPPGLVAAVAPAEGRPLWIEEIVGSAVTDGTLHRDGSGWVFATGGGQRVPHTLAAGVARRLDELRDARPVLECAAVLGKEFSTRLLADALGGPDHVGRALRAGCDAGLLSADGIGGAVGFRHELLRDAVLAGLLDAERRAHAATLLAALPPAMGPTALGARLALEAGDPERASVLFVDTARLELARGLPAAAAHTLDRALETAGPALRLGIRELRVHALALAGDVDRALADAVIVDAVLAEIPDSDARRSLLGEAVVRATAGQGRWSDAEQLVAALRSRFPDAPGPAALSANVALERGHYTDAEREARAALDGAGSEPTARCEAMEVLGRLARRADLSVAEQWFRRAVATAEQGGLAIWRARALHELATVAQLRDFDIGPLTLARAAAVEAAAPGLETAVTLHLAAVCGVRFEPDAALPLARQTLDSARRLGARRQEAFAWILIGQAHAVAGEATRADVAATEALTHAPADPEIVGLAWTICRGLPALLADDVDTATRYWRRGIDALRDLPAVTPFPPWFLWCLLATSLDLEGDGGARARAETASRELRVSTGADALWHLAEALARGRDGDRDGAAQEVATADALFARLPNFAGYRHLGRRVAADAAIAGGWGEPAAWMVDADRWASARGFSGLARAARSLGRRAGVPQRRSGRGDSTVPATLATLGVTTREMDVLLLVAEGLTNKEIARRLYITPRTVKGHVELLLAKTGAANRTQLAHRVDPDQQP